MSERPDVVLQSGSAYAIWVAGAVGLLGLPIVGTVLWFAHLLDDGPTLSGVAIFASLYTVQMLGATVGVHRYLSHRSFEASQPVKVFLCVAASMSQGPILPWAANHRRHHQIADKEGDFHTPHRPVPARRFGGSTAVRIWNLFHAHYGWIFRRGLASNERYVKDLLQDPVVVWVDDKRFRWGVMAFVLPALLGAAAAGGSWAGLWDGFRWGCLSLFCVQNATFSINSICHVVGTRRYRTNDHSTNNRLVGVAAFGEGWHNNHHSFPASARFGIDRRQLDIGYRFITLLERVGLVWNVKHGPDRSSMAKKQLV